MSEQLKIENFLTIKQAVVDIRPFTILIGPEATGKSVIAKLLYFFQSVLSEELFAESIHNREPVSRLAERAVERFEQIFPRYTWGQQKFSLSLKTDGWELKLSQGQDSTLSFSISDRLADLYQRSCDRYNESFQNEFGNSELLSRRLQLDWLSAVRTILDETGLSKIFNRPIFVPASRSFFATLQKNIFSLLKMDIPLDLLIKEFGSVYEAGRPYLASNNLTHLFPVNERTRNDIREILGGEYLHEDGEDWIVSDGRKVNLAQASSGQQEVVPLLCVLVAFHHSFDTGITFFIEEPEAHLFPFSQRRLINIFSISAQMPNRFFLTTHSPYILTALNSLILASNIIERRPDAEAAAKKVIGPAEPIRFDDVSAYTINGGCLTSIMDAESKLIGDSIIDSVSDEFESVTNDLIDLSLNKAS